jgi:4-hydroxy-4-methyl-2-oxoglutarate aldolase
MNALLDRARLLTAAGVSDAMDRLGIGGQVPGVRPVDPSFRLCGPAFTVKYRPVEAVGETVGDYIDDVLAGSVVVIANQGRTDCTVWGDILTETAHSRGLAGTVIDGLCRDAAWAARVGYPVYAVATWMRTGKDRVTVEAVGTPIDIAGVPVAPGDIVIGDRDGLVVVPAGRMAEVVELAESIELVEEQIRIAVRSGERLDAARSRLGYHSLQRAEATP